MDEKPFEQRLVAFEYFLEGVHEQAFAEPAGPGKEKRTGMPDQFPCYWGFVHIHTVVFHDFGKGVDTDGQMFHL
jgi:hypothetical protein